MNAVSVGGFNNEIISLGNGFGVIYDWLIGISDITAENNFFVYSIFGKPDFNTCRAEKMAYIRKSYFHTLANLYFGIVGTPAQEFYSAGSII